jgi:hypothetical protein
MLASWKMKEMEEILHRYFHSEKITAKELFIEEKGKYAPSCNDIRKSLKLVAIGGLKYFPTEENLKLLKSLSGSDDKELQTAVTKAIKYMNL